MIVPMTVTGANRLAVLLRQGGPRAVRAAREAMKREAANITKLAKDNCPVLHHDLPSVERRYAGTGPGPLEDSIKEERGYEDNRRLQIFINCGEGLGDYPLMMEEGLAPYGSGAFNLGPLSMQKRAEGKDVGGKFMERALKARQDKIPATILTAVETELDV